MKKIHSLILVGASMPVASCATTLKNAPMSNVDISDNESNPITKLKVTFDFNGGTYNGESTITFNDVMPTTYFRYVKERLTKTITPPEHYGALKGYSFSIDDKDNLIPNDYVIREDITVYAQYEISDPYCTVQWLDEDGSTLATENYFLNDTPEFKGTLPYYEGKIFGHWDPAIHPITQAEIDAGSTSYTAVYVTVYHEVVLDYNDGSTSEEHTQKVLDGECLVEPKITREGYKLDKWKYVSGGSGDFNFNNPITTDGIKIEASWVPKKYTVTWLNCDGSVIKTEEVDDGDAPIRPSDPVHKFDLFAEYTFSDWAPTVSKEVHSDQIYVATYKVTHFYENAQIYMNIDITNDKTFQFTCTAETNITIDWGDGTREERQAGTISHQYGKVGKYNVRVLSPFTTISASRNTLIKELYIGKDATLSNFSTFEKCSNLQTVTFEKGSTLTSIGNYAFFDCSKLQTVTFEGESKLKTIGSLAFSSCSSLTSITIPSGVTSIGDDAFDNCSKLQTVTFEAESELESIDNQAFSNCPLLTSITIPSKVTSIGDSVFKHCLSLEKLIVDHDNQTYTSQDDDGNPCNAIITKDGKTLIAGCKATKIPSSVTSIGNNAFEGCSSLESITIPSSVTSIGSHAFDTCSSLTSITIPSGVTSIGYRTFYGCSNLQTVTFEGESELESINNEVFQDCYSLTSITIPSKVTSIGDSAFRYCSSLTSIDISSSITSIGDSAFSGCSNLVKITVDLMNPIYTSRDEDETPCDAIITKDGKTLIVGCKTTKIPSSVTSIGNNAFEGCSSLESITIPSSVTSIDIYAFHSCSNLQIVTFEGESKLESIGDLAFSGCYSLTSITIPSSVTSIGEAAFESCYSLTSITIPSSVTSIGGDAFFDCSELKIVDLTALDTPPNLGEYVFTSCHDDLKLYVKTNMLEAFKSASGWSDYESIITDDPVPSTNI